VRARTQGSGYLAAKNDGNGMSRIVRRPGAAAMTRGIELTVIEAVAMSPWIPP
jgi:hypothetical protein